MMRVLLALVCLVGVHVSIFSQTLGDAYWNKIQDRADSVVISRFGTTFFMDHVFAPVDPLDYIVIGEYSHSWDERDTITRVPEHCYFEYDIGLDSLNSGWMCISFSITPEGLLIVDEDLKGFVEGTPPIMFHTDLQGFIALAKKKGVKCKRKEAFRDLRWVPLDTTAVVHANGVGRYELILGRDRGNRTWKGPDIVHTYRLVDAIVFDPFTGAVLRKGERIETISVACGVGTL